MTKLSKKVIKQVENILKSYPFWLISIEAGGLGSPSRYLVEGDRSCMNGGSSVEYIFDHEEKIKMNMKIVEAVHSLLNDTEKKLVELRYYQDFNTDEVIQEMNLCHTKFYRIRRQVLIKHALAFGFIEKM